MGLLAVIFFIFFYIIHVFNGGSITEMEPVVVICVALWMLDIAALVSRVSYRMRPNKK